VAAAQRYARGREGLVSFAVVGSDGRTGGLAEDRSYVSASVVKALLLAAELRRLDDGGLPLDDSTRGLLASMITWSDNEAADMIYARVGDAGLAAVAGRAGMERFSAGGHWSAAQITAADMASFFSRLGRSLPESTDGFAKGLLGSVVKEQSWGIPQAAGADWEVRFKGGWRATERGQLVHQAAELRRGGERVGLAVLTDAQPSRGYAVATVRGVAERLLSRRPE
jgi:beta-lactamase class A